MNQKGFTIIEIIIGLALLSSAMIVATLTYASLARLQDRGAAARVVQQNGRYVLEAIERDIRNAGAVCLRSGPNCVSSGSTTMDLSSSLQGGGQIEYTYCASSCSGGVDGQIFRAECNPGCGTPVSVSGQDVRISAPPQYTYVQGPRPFVKIHLEVEQKLSGLTKFDAYYAHYNLDTTVTTRQ